MTRITRVINGASALKSLANIESFATKVRVDGGKALDSRRAAAYSIDEIETHSQFHLR
jgi:hypothetical protein